MTIFRAGLLVLCLASLVPPTASAQTEGERSWSVVPLLGFGAVGDHGNWGSAGVETALDVGYGGGAWRWSGYASLRGIGVGCSAACFDGGWAFAGGASRSVGPLWIGAGAGAMRQLGQWHFLPYARISLDAARFRFDVRVELPRQTGVGVYVPALIGMPLSP